MRRQLRPAAAIAALACLLTTPPAAADPIELIGTFPVNPGSGFVADVWGWVDPATSREYAIFGSNPTGLYIVDVTDPSVPTLVKYLSMPGFDMKTWGNYLYSCTGTGSLVDKTTAILNIANPANPVVVGSTYGAHNIAISDAGMLYLCSPNLQVLDLTAGATNPSRWFTSSTGSHDATIRGNMVYDFAASFGGAIIREHTGPLTLLTRGQCFDATIRYYHSGDISADGKYLFVCDELAVGEFADITIFDISTPSTPVKVNTINDPLSTVHNLYVVGDVMYVSYYRSGFKAFNIANPANPSLIGVYDTSPFFGDGFDGCFGVYPFLPSGNILVTDMGSGLYVFQMTTTVAVRFSQFSATAAGDGAVELSWSLHADEHIAGFHLYRAGAAGELRLTDIPLPAVTRSYRDETVAPGGAYSYVVAAVRGDGTEERSPRVSASVPTSQSGIVSVEPNPFNPNTTVQVRMGAATRARLDVFDARGRLVRNLADGDLPAGQHAFGWDGRDDRGVAAASGVYLARFQAGKQATTRRMVLLK